MKNTTLRRFTKISIFVVCAAMLVVMIDEYLSNIRGNPAIGTSTEIVQFDTRKLQQMMICVAGWGSDENKNPIPLEQAFALAFGNGKEAIQHHSVPDESFEKLMLNSSRYTTSEDAYMKEVNKIYNVVTQVEEEEKFTRIPLSPTFMETNTPCGYVNRSERRIVLRAETSSMPMLPRTTVLEPDYIRYWFQMPSGRRNFKLSFYIPESIEHLLIRHFYEYAFSPPKGKKGRKHWMLRMNLDVRVTKFVNLYTEKNPCIEAPDNLVLPVSYYEEACNVDCMFETIQRTFGCIPLPLYFEGNRSGRPCHSLKWDYNNFGIDSAAQAKFQETLATCLSRKACETRRPCTEWEIRIRNVEPPRVFKPEHREKKITTVEIGINFISKMTVITQYKRHSLAEMVGNVGGLVGIWLGVSIYAISGLVVSWFFAPNRRPFRNAIRPGNTAPPTNPPSNEKANET